MIIAYMLFAVILVLCPHRNSLALRLIEVKCIQRKLVLSTFVAASILMPPMNPAFAGTEMSLQDQVKVLKSKQEVVQKEVLQMEDQKLIAKEIAYPAGRLVAKGSITLKNQDSQALPLGFRSAADIDAVYTSNDASLFVLAIGREGPVLAAKKYPLKDLQFPMVFELVSSDLLPPNTEESWAESANSKDSVALTAIISSSGALAQPQGFERIGLGVSDPVTFAGAKIRSTARINVFDKLNLKLYTPKEIDLLSAVDDELAKRAATIVSAPSAPDSASKKSSTTK